MYLFKCDEYQKCEIILKKQNENIWNERNTSEMDEGQKS